jgi:hypothetical protein
LPTKTPWIVANLPALVAAQTAGLSNAPLLKTTGQRRVGIVHRITTTSMSARQAPQLEALIHDQHCSFNGSAWTSTDDELADRLNRALNSIPEPRAGVFEIAEQVIRNAGVSEHARIISCREGD